MAVEKVERIALEFVESDEMRRHLHSIGPMELRTYCWIVACAPASLEKKAGALRQMEENLPPVFWEHPEDRRLPANMAKVCEIALAEMQSAPGDGAVFLLNDETSDDATPFMSFAAVQNFVQERYDELKRKCPVILDEGLWYTVEKWLPSGKNGGTLEVVLEWVLNANGEIWYFDEPCADRQKETASALKWVWDTCGSDFSFRHHLDMPSPFQPGDIITINCHPFEEPYHAVMYFSEVDGNGTAYGWYFYMDYSDGGGGELCSETLGCGPHMGNSFPGWYRAVRYTGELSEVEAILGEISAALHADPSLGEKWMAWQAEHRAGKESMDWEGFYKEHRKR